MDKEARAWDLYAHVEAQVKNMMSSLRAVSELQNPAIRDRHWQELMAETRVRRRVIIARLEILIFYIYIHNYYNSNDPYLHAHFYIHTNYCPLLSATDFAACAKFSRLLEKLAIVCDAAGEIHYGR